MIYPKKTNGGFTLIELIVVIAIIGLLSRIVLISMEAAKVKARDTWRKSQLVQLQNALALYYAKYGRYPISQDLWSTAINTADFGLTAARGTGANGYIPGLVPEFIAALPVDPQASYDKPGFVYTTRTENTGKHYKILLWKTAESAPDSKFLDPFRIGFPVNTWMVTDRPEFPPSSVTGLPANATPVDICTTENAPPYPGILDYPICW